MKLNKIGVQSSGEMTAKRKTKKKYTRQLHSSCGRGVSMALTASPPCSADLGHSFYYYFLKQTKKKTINFNRG